MPRGAKFYVGGPERKDFKTLKAAREFFDANPDYSVLGRWVETVRESPLFGSMKSSSGEIIEDRRKP